MAKQALFLEGGGMRCIFTAGVLEAFLKRNIEFDTIYGISAGATAATSFISKQAGRNKRVFSDYVDDPNYKGFKHWFKSGSYFNIDYIFNTIPNELDPFDYDTFFKSKVGLQAVLTDCETGEASFFDVKASQEDFKNVLIAATSLPLMAPPVLIRGRYYLDGGIGWPLLCDQLLEQDYDHVTFVLTQKMGYQKPPEKSLPLIKFVLRQYPKIGEMIKIRHTVYNQTLAKIHSLADDPRVTVIYPGDDFNVKRVEHEAENVLKAYQDGYQKGLAYKIVGGE